MTRVLIVDDQSTFRLQLRRLLERAGVDVVGEAKDELDLSAVSAWFSDGEAQPE